ncbi:unnamed protein product [Zymoseptoria tritici ST99CH_1E4]|uniref:Uncharacterized protein n=1 Tax=Zymoseptoria tritici ST99CH_1E4 TaxID=1276532 RepID=A0A2H1GQL9_ZYMTR|nr:unnamed protein product [Zymoseptoria tritici ST99CH_1E4]
MGKPRTSAGFSPPQTNPPAPSPPPPPPPSRISSVWLSHFATSPADLPLTTSSPFETILAKLTASTCFTTSRRFLKPVTTIMKRGQTPTTQQTTRLAIDILIFRLELLSAGDKLPYSLGEDLIDLQNCIYVSRFFLDLANVRAASISARTAKDPDVHRLLDLINVKPYEEVLERVAGMKGCTRAEIDLAAITFGEFVRDTEELELGVEVEDDIDEWIAGGYEE